MTPKRYFAFGALAVAIQSGVIASQPSITMLQSTQTSSANQASLANRVNSVTLNFSAATLSTKTFSTATQPSSTASEASIESTRETESKVATAKSTAPKTSIPKPVDNAVIAKAEKAKADKQIDSQLAKTHSATISHPDTDSFKSGALVHKRSEQLEQKIEPKQTDWIADTAEIEAKKIEEITSVEADRLRPNNSIPANDSLKTNIVELAKPLFATAPPQPTYPRIARKKGLEGTATIEVMFNELGEQLALTLITSSGFSLLDQAAIEAVENWQFAAPTPKLASHYKVRVPIRFALN